MIHVLSTGCIHFSVNSLVVTMIDVLSFLAMGNLPLILGKQGSGGMPWLSYIESIFRLDCLFNSWTYFQIFNENK